MPIIRRDNPLTKKIINLVISKERVYATIDEAIIAIPSPEFISPHNLAHK